MRSHILKWSKIVSSQNFIPDTHDYYWIDFLFPEGKRIPVDAKKTHTCLQSFLLKFDYENMSVYKGLAGIGLSLMHTLNDRNM